MINIVDNINYPEGIGTIWEGIYAGERKGASY
jgi:hypothetical protein